VQFHFARKSRRSSYILIHLKPMHFINKCWTAYYYLQLVRNRQCFDFSEEAGRAGNVT
jgi:hypothetical protein